MASVDQRNYVPIQEGFHRIPSHDVKDYMEKGQIPDLLKPLEETAKLLTRSGALYRAFKKTVAANTWLIRRETPGDRLSAFTLVGSPLLANASISILFHFGKVDMSQPPNPAYGDPAHTLNVYANRAVIEIQPGDLTNLRANGWPRVPAPLNRIEVRSINVIEDSADMGRIIDSRSQLLRMSDQFPSYQELNRANDSIALIIGKAQSYASGINPNPGRS